MKPSVFVIGISSDIGFALAEAYQQKGYEVYGSFRSTLRKNDFDESRMFQVDVSEHSTVQKIISEHLSGVSFDLVISCVGVLEPILPFFEIEFKDWLSSFETNSTDQLHFVHSLRPQIKSGASVVLLHGGAPNGVLKNYSAYSLGKIALAKMVEYLDAEDDNVNYFILGTGWVKTRIHDQTLRAKEKAGENYQRTKDLYASDRAATSIDEIFDCITWCVDQGRSVLGGRNIAVAGDSWGAPDKGKSLVAELSENPDMFKLRRHQN